MGSFLFIILILFFAIIGLIASFVFRFLRLFSKPINRSNSRDFNSKNNRDQEDINSNSSHSQQKIFRKDEGEYVDYEEIK